jgi:tRNA modification GTPase
MAVNPDCLVTQLTPRGRGAVASVGVRGENAVHNVQRAFRSVSKKRLTDFPYQRIVYGKWQIGDSAGEDVVVCRHADDSLDVHCHGGQAAVDRIVNSLVEMGCREASAEEFSRREESDVIRAEARLALRQARTSKTGAILLDQYRGALRTAIERTITTLQDRDLQSSRQSLEQLQRHFDLGLHLTQPWRVVVAGPPNAGKSSLVNRMLGYERAIVFDQPGTTRDVLTAVTVIDLWPIELVDTAGLRESADEIERIGIQRAENSIQRADLVLRVYDITRTTRKVIASQATNTAAEFVVMNKVDLLSEPATDAPLANQISAKTGHGVTELMQSIVKFLVPHSIPSGAAVPFTVRQQTLIEQALKWIDVGDSRRAAETLENVTSFSS